MGFWKKLLVTVGIASLSASAPAAIKLAEQAAFAANQAVETAKKVDGTVLDYSPNSLKDIDKIVLGIRRGGTSPDEVKGILFILGAYVGEVIIRNIEGSQWSQPKEVQAAGLTAMGVSTNDGIFWNPIGKVHKLLINGEEDSVVHFYNVIKDKNR
ncbi:MAG: hypothetical protein OQL27_02980 [Sedimenticola sp.]|nr:hypothetical protein [Sedimenticola sp.]